MAVITKIVQQKRRPNIADFIKNSQVQLIINTPSSKGPQTDEGQIRELLRQGIGANPQAVADYKKGKVRAADRIKGFVMKQTKGMANTELVQRLLEEELAKN